MNGDLPSGAVSTGRSALPEDLLREAAHRLAVVCLATAALWAVEFVLVHLVHPLPGTLQDTQLARHAQWVPVFDLVGGASFLLSLTLFWYTRRSRRSARFLLDLALMYEVSIALSIGLLDYAVGTPVHVVVTFSPALQAGATVTITTMREGAERVSSGETVEIDRTTPCVFGTLPELEVGHHVVRVDVDPSAMQPLEGEIEITPK